MGYNSNCKDQNCTQNCCNVYGDCPKSGYTSSALTKCKYYYTTQSQGLDGSQIGSIVGPIIAFVVVIVVIVCCCKRYRQQQVLKNIQAQTGQQNKNTTMNNINLTTEYADPNTFNQGYIQQPQQPFGQGQVQQPYGQSLGQAYGPVQPPIYGSPEQALFGVPGQQVSYPPQGYPPVANPTYYGPGPIFR